MKKNILFPVFLFIVLFAQAQPSGQQFYSSVKIEFEKKVAMHALYKEMWPEWFDQVKDRVPKNVDTYFDFIGDSTHSIFKPGKDNRDPRTNDWFQPLANQNIVYTNFQTKKSISYKPIFEEKFLVEDTLLKIKWKITNDTRDIAGFECRKAIGILWDTVAVFAFYTDELMITGGPEGIQGLPGMILGIGIPRLHTTWFATKVQVVDVPMNLVTPEKKGKKTDRQGMIKLLQTAMKDWDNFGKKMVIATQI